MQFGKARASRFACVIVLGLVGSLFAGSACSNDAVGVDECIIIEQARCELAPQCVSAGIPDFPQIKTQDEIDNCKVLYRDHCQVGLENTANATPTTAQANTCVTALTELVACQKAGVTTIGGCKSKHVSADNGDLAPCYVFLHPEHLSACQFVASQTTSSTGGTGGTGGTASTTDTTSVTATTGAL